MREVREWAVMQDIEFSLSYIGIDSLGPVPVNNPYYTTLKKSLKLNWDNAILLAIF